MQPALGDQAPHAARSRHDTHAGTPHMQACATHRARIHSHAQPHTHSRRRRATRARPKKSNSTLKNAKDLPPKNLRTRTRGVCCICRASWPATCVCRPARQRRSPRLVARPRVAVHVGLGLLGLLLRRAFARRSAPAQREPHIPIGTGRTADGRRRRCDRRHTLVIHGHG